ncbi:hypothetical protein PHSY_005337 [Pseudozyma hubeiensis SY62]|uniref:RING-type E3 ubiquitin transferase n=1 Tax=Pseudozyma hubeiensis (strain SY62) TaxID=1305764 RepID=R9PI28_PSEHS|nr:hypothetical protein PHSY_005337 [Pseudozyma hubeiensis SY62]GAC97750.1 hypothetical protein PHSY_005337 [Pseudozyma hubeiensis SY62]
MLLFAECRLETYLDMLGERERRNQGSIEAAHLRSTLRYNRYGSTMSAMQESKPPPSSSSSRGSRGGSSSNRRGGGSSRGGASGGEGRRANFGGSLTPSDPNRAAASNSRGRSNNHSRSNRPQKDRPEPQQVSAQDQVEPLSATTAVQGNTQDAAPNDDGDDELPPEAELCFICADPVKLTSVAPCDHRTCHICALRLRVLYKKDECTFCKATIDHLIFTSNPTKSFSDFQPSDIPYTDKKLPISFETKEALEETVLLLRFNCPDPNCEIACTGWKDLRAHVRREHARMVCQLCISNKKIFAHEHTLHTEQSLAAHEKAEHRLCEYDRQWFYSDDELFAHMRDRHEQCFICKASGNEDERWKYYRDYDMLERHFRKDHWLCENKECLEEKFRVFKDEVDYKAHQLERHANELSSRERRDALRIEAGFTYDDPSVGSSRSGAGVGGGKKGKGRANGGAEASQENRDVLGVSSLASRAHVPGAGPANHQSRRAMFGSGLTNPTPAAPPQGVSADRPRTITDTRSTEQRHQAYMDKVTSLLQTDSRITSFRHAVRLFKNNESSARDLISTFHSLVGETGEECATLVNGMIDLLDGEKREEMGRAWNEWRERCRSQTHRHDPHANIQPNTEASLNNHDQGYKYKKHHSNPPHRSVPSIHFSPSALPLSIDPSTTRRHTGGQPIPTTHSPTIQLELQSILRILLVLFLLLLLRRCEILLSSFPTIPFIGNGSGRVQIRNSRGRHDAFEFRPELRNRMELFSDRNGFFDLAVQRVCVAQDGFDALRWSKRLRESQYRFVKRKRFTQSMEWSCLNTTALLPSSSVVWSCRSMPSQHDTTAATMTLSYRHAVSHTVDDHIDFPPTPNPEVVHFVTFSQHPYRASPPRPRFLTTVSVSPSPHPRRVGFLRAYLGDIPNQSVSLPLKEARILGVIV